MTGEKRIDFSSLDPTRDSGRFETVVRSVVERTMARRAARKTVGYQLLLWARPAIAVAAVAAMVLFVGAMLLSSAPGEDAEPCDERALVLTQLASGHTAISTYQILDALGARHVDP